MRSVLVLGVLWGCGAPVEEQTVADVLANNCALSGCHAGPDAQVGMSLEREHYRASTVLVPVESLGFLCPNQPLRVRPGDPDASCLWHLVDEEIMPLDNPPLDEAEKRVVRQWILDGAP